MGFNESVINLGRVPGIGDVQTRRVVMTGGTTSFTSAAAFTDIYGISYTSIATNGTASVIGSSGTVLGAGFNGNDTVTLIITGLE